MISLLLKIIIIKLCVLHFFNHISQSTHCQKRCDGSHWSVTTKSQNSCKVNSLLKLCHHYGTFSQLRRDHARAYLGCVSSHRQVSLVTMCSPCQLHPEDLHSSPQRPCTSPAKLWLVCLFYLDVYLWNVWRQINPFRKKPRGWCHKCRGRVFTRLGEFMFRCMTSMFALKSYLHEQWGECWQKMKHVSNHVTIKGRQLAAKFWARPQLTSKSYINLSRVTYINLTCVTVTT